MCEGAVPGIFAGMGLAGRHAGICATVLILLLPGMAAAPVAASSPASLYSGADPRPGPDLLYRPLATAPQLTNAPGSVWQATSILVSGASAYRAGRSRMAPTPIHPARVTTTMPPTWSSSGSSRLRTRPPFGSRSTPSSIPPCPCLPSRSEPPARHPRRCRMELMAPPRRRCSLRYTTPTPT